MFQDRGEIALIEDGKRFQHLGYFSLKEGKDYYRGSHYHRKKVECLYVIRGRLHVEWVDLEQNRKSSMIIHEGQRVSIFPLCAHRFSARQESQVIEYYDSRYDPDDDLPYTEF